MAQQAQLPSNLSGVAIRNTADIMKGLTASYFKIDLNDAKKRAPMPLISLYTIQAAQAAKLGQQIEHLPNPNDSIRTTQAVLDRVKTSNSPQAKQSMGILAGDIQAPVNNARNYMQQVETLSQRFKLFVGTLTDTMRKILEDFNANPSSQYKLYLERLRQLNPEFKALEAEIKTTDRSGLEIANQFLTLSKKAYDIIPPNEKSGVEPPQPQTGRSAGM